MFFVTFLSTVELKDSICKFEVEICTKTYSSEKSTAIQCQKINKQVVLIILGMVN